MAAHTLARSCEHSVSSFIHNGVPECIRKTLCNDFCDNKVPTFSLKKRCNLSSRVFLAKLLDWVDFRKTALSCGPDRN